MRRVGKMVLNRNPDNFFAETEQVAFHPGHVVPGIDFSNDPLLQGRLFSYFDTQIKRVGPNFAELPINRPSARFQQPARRGGQHDQQGAGGLLPQFARRRCHAASANSAEAFEQLSGDRWKDKGQAEKPSFADHFSQATLFWNSMATGRRIISSRPSASS